MTGPVPICYCIDALARGGTELQLLEMIRRLDRSAIQPHLLTIRSGDDIPLPADCPHLKLPVHSLASLDGLRSLLVLRRWFKEKNIKIIHTFFQDSTVLAGTAAKLAGVPVRIAGFRDLGFWRGGREEWLLRRAYPLMTGFIANSEMVRDHFVEADGLAPAKISVIYNGIDPEQLSWLEHSGPTLNVGIVSNLNREVKRVDLFVEAAGMVAAEHPEIRWHVLGDGALRPMLKAQAEKVGLGSRIRFAGRVSDVPSEVANLQVAVNCSDSEGFSNAVMEYMFRGCAVVATEVGGNCEAIRNNVSGLLVPPNDPTALAAAIRRLVMDVDLRRQLAKQARSFAENRFNWDRCLTEHIQLYEQSLGGRAGE